MRVIAVDYGDARTGVAVSDPTGGIAGDRLTLTERVPERLAKRLAELARERGASAFVLGLPRNMDGTEGPRAEKTRVFKAMLERASGLAVDLWDERLTSRGARLLLHEAGCHGRRNQAREDAAAAALILEGYLARRTIST
ncbi:MAG: Holliday junction resolvase RuvX [Oscillospiraceae bacterium]|nr:Holliday junction resolvase RuvX [Oscillospiraceae bacterium]